MKKVMLIACALFAINLAHALNPVKEYSRTPADFRMQFEEFKAPTSDGLELHGWYFKNPKSTKRYIIVSDDGDGNMADNLEIVQELLNAGYNVLTYDYRGFGKSSEFEINPKNYIYPEFIRDLDAIIGYARKHNMGVKFDLYGLGMGAGLSIGVGANRTEIQRIIADSPFTTLDLIKTKLRINNESVVVPFNYNRKFEPVYSLEDPHSNLRGILLIHGSNDELVGKEEIKQFKSTARKLLEFYEVDKATSYKETHKKDTEQYLKEIKNFIDKTS